MIKGSRESYTQVYLEGPGHKHMTRWLLTRYAKVGSSILIANARWKILERYATMKGETVETHKKDFKIVLLD